MRLSAALLLIAALLFGADRAEAHFTSTNYLTAASPHSGDDIRITWDISAADVHWSLFLDANGDGAITWEEIEAKRDEIASLAQWHLQVARGGRSCDTFRRSTPDDPRAGTAPLPGLQRPLPEANRRALPERHALLRHQHHPAHPDQRHYPQQASSPQSLSPDTPAGPSPEPRRVATTFVTFVGQGLWHVWIGYDHLAFLLLLLLPGVCVVGLRDAPKSLSCWALVDDLGIGWPAIWFLSQ